MSEKFFLDGDGDDDAELRFSARPVLVVTYERHEITCPGFGIKGAKYGKDIWGICNKCGMQIEYFKKPIKSQK